MSEVDELSRPVKASEGLRIVGQMVGQMTDITDEGILRDFSNALLFVIKDFNLYEVLGCSPSDDPTEIAARARAMFNGIHPERMRAYTDVRAFAPLSELTLNRKLRTE